MGSGVIANARSASSPAGFICFCPTAPDAMLDMDARAVQWGTACRSAAASVVLSSIERIQVGSDRIVAGQYGT
jgi:hypothetical protein